MNTPHDQIQALSAENENLRKLNEANTRQIHTVTTECQRLSRLHEKRCDERDEVLTLLGNARREIDAGKAELTKERKAHNDTQVWGGCFAIVAGILIAFAFTAAWVIRSHRIDDLKEQLRNARAGSGFIIIQ